MEALQKIQSELKAPKNRRNKFGNYNYRSCEDILEAVKPLLSKYGAELTLTDEAVAVGDRYYIKATAQLKQGEETVTVQAYAREAETKKGMDDSQITGTASSYARKYALNGLFLIDDTKDADTDEYHNLTHEELASAEDKRKFIARCKEIAGDGGQEMILRTVGVKGKMTAAQYDKAMELLDKIEHGTSA